MTKNQNDDRTFLLSKMLAQHNPLGVVRRTEDIYKADEFDVSRASFAAYPYPMHAYLDFLRSVASLFPKGYVELPVLLRYFMPIKIRTSELLSICFQCKVLPQVAFFPDWKPSFERNNYLETLCHMMAQYNNTVHNGAAFDLALKEFDKRFNSYGKL